MEKNFEQKINEWRRLREKNTMIVQDYVPGKNLTLSNTNYEEMKRKEELAKELFENISELGLNPHERHELKLDAKI